MPAAGDGEAGAQMPAAPSGPAVVFGANGAVPPTVNPAVVRRAGEEGAARPARRRWTPRSMQWLLPPPGLCRKLDKTLKLCGLVELLLIGPVMVAEVSLIASPLLTIRCLLAALRLSSLVPFCWRRVRPASSASWETQLHLSLQAAMLRGVLIFCWSVVLARTFVRDLNCGGGGAGGYLYLSVMMIDQMHGMAEASALHTVWSSKHQSPETPNELPLVKFTYAAESGVEAGESGFEPTCVICLSSFAEGDELARLPCGHTFHQACIGQWLAQAAACPMRCPYFGPHDPQASPGGTTASRAEEGPSPPEDAVSAGDSEPARTLGRGSAGSNEPRAAGEAARGAPHAENMA